MSKFAIAIPTYNRSEILLENLMYIKEELLQFQIPIYISDDSTDNKTEQAILEFSNEYSYIYYHKNSPGLGHDMNCLKTLSLPNEKYVWYLGDSMIIKKGTIEILAKIIMQQDWDIISFNAESRCEINLESGKITDLNLILDNLAWHLTMTGVTVYNRSVVDNLNIDINKCKNFPQLAILLESLIKKEDFNFFWLNQNLIRGNKKKTSYWAKNIFSVFITDLFNVFNNLSIKIPTEKVDKIVKTHTVNTNIFSARSLIYLRAFNVYSYNVYLEYGNQIAKYAGHNKLILLVLSFFPKYPLKTAISLLTSFNQKRK